MRKLIRPALFVFARLGVFLSITAWIVTHWWTFTIGSLVIPDPFVLRSDGLIVTNPWMEYGQGGEFMTGGFGHSSLAAEKEPEAPATVDYEEPTTIADWDAANDPERNALWEAERKANTLQIKSENLSLLIDGGIPEPLDPSVDYELEPIRDYLRITPRGCAYDDYHEFPLWTEFAPGVAVVKFQDAVDEVLLRHWLIVSIFILFYATLRFIYRMKPDGGEGDA